MADLATPDFLASLRALFLSDSDSDSTSTSASSSSSDQHLWAIVAAVSFSAANVADAVPLVFQFALDDLVRAQQQPDSNEARSEQLALARKIREAVLQSGLLSGMPRVSRFLRACCCVGGGAYMYSANDVIAHSASETEDRGGCMYTERTGFR